MEIPNFYFAIILLGVSGAFTFSIKDSTDDDTPRPVTLTLADLKMDYTSAVAASNIMDVLNELNKEEANPSANKLYWPSLSRTRTGLTDLMQNVPRQHPQEKRGRMLPPWSEFCQMLKMRECNRYKRSGLYRAFKGPLNSRRP